jgi:hypothetical protein
MAYQIAANAIYSGLSIVGRAQNGQRAAQRESVKAISAHGRLLTSCVQKVPISQQQPK